MFTQFSVLNKTTKTHVVVVVCSFHFVKGVEQKQKQKPFL
jgi:hypothetical protein